MENKINIEEIMAQIKREIEEKGLTPDMLSFEDVPYKKPVQAAAEPGASLSDAGEAFAYVNAHHYVQPYKPLAGNPLKVFFKKVIRKLTKFYVEPVVFEQNSFNAAAVNILNVMKTTAEAHAGDDSENLLSRLETIELAQKELRSRIDSLERENAALREELGKQEAE